MYQAQAIIERIRRVSGTVQRIDIAVDNVHRNITAGQLFLARVTESFDPYLREPFTPVQRDGSCIIVERPITQSYYPGQVINLLGPVGKPIPVREAARTLLLIAYESAPTSLLLLAQNALAKGVSVALALLGSAVHYPLEALPQEIEIMRGDDKGNWSNQQQTLRWADQVVAVAPPPFDMDYYARLLDTLRQIRVEIPDGYVFGLIQPPLPCGVGACHACMVRYQKEDVPACQEGPAFDLLHLKEVSK